MSKTNRRPGPRPPGGPRPQGGAPQSYQRLPLIPENPLPGWQALVQATLLLGIPLSLLVAAKLILRAFFPSLGY